MSIKLGDICTFQSGGTPSKGNPEFFNGCIPWITTTSLNGSQIDERDAVEWITEEAIQKSAAKIVPAHSIMVGTRVGVGKVAVNAVNMSTSQDVISLLNIDENAWSKDFLCKFLQGKSAYLNSQARGATIKGIKIDVLANLEVPVFNIRKQKRISDILDKVRLIIKAREQELVNLDDLIKARFVEMFGDPADNLRADKVELSEICEKITDGEHGSVARVPSGHPFLNAKHVLKNGQIDWDTITYIGNEDHQRIYKRCNPEEGDILLTTTGTIGNVAIMPKSEEVSMDRGITLLKIDRQRVTSEFVAELLKQPSIQTEMGVNVHASAIGHLFMNKVKKLPAILPSMERQIKFTAFVRQVDKSKLPEGYAILNLRLLYSWH